ncbi:hypothetical protein CK203_043700 [Vitis vinifera]|uniref:Uncharacterized protein n=1 Tax=Vitis vinifera TaxID=29760 RepID=A0A438GYR4_VITVI|nr:hypothetical protein CK203_043700 [Vitis vinifera]
MASLAPPHPPLPASQKSRHLSWASTPPDLPAAQIHPANHLFDLPFLIVPSPIHFDSIHLIPSSMSISHLMKKPCVSIPSFSQIPLFQSKSVPIQKVFIDMFPKPQWLLLWLWWLGVTSGEKSGDVTNSVLRFSEMIDSLCAVTDHKKTCIDTLSQEAEYSKATPIDFIKIIISRLRRGAKCGCHQRHFC